MIYNFYSYLFFTALAVGAAFAVLLRTLNSPKRRIVWDISSISFLLFLILSVLVFFSGLIIVDPESIDLIRSIIFFLIFFIMSTVLLYFLRIVFLPIVLFILFTLSLYYYYNLAEFTPFQKGISWKVTVLKSTEDTIAVELRNFNNDIEFLNIKTTAEHPVFTIIDFSEYLFFLNSSSYIKFDGFNQSSHSFKLPFSSTRIYEPAAVEDTIYSSLEVRLEPDGSLNYIKGNY